MRNNKLQRLVECALLAAVYTAISLVLAPVSFGPVQLRAAEALTLLPVLSPTAIVGVTAGCLLTNSLGTAMGLTMPQDILFGTAATLLAACLTYALRSVRWRSLPVAAALPPILVNAVIVGWEITFFFFPAGSPPALYLANVFWVGLGEAVVCLGLGLPLVYAMQKTGLDNRLFRS